MLTLVCEKELETPFVQIIHRNPSLPLTIFSKWFHVGSRTPKTEILGIDTYVIKYE